LPLFCDKRKQNFKSWLNIFSKYPDYFITPKATEHSDPAWFAFIVTLKENVPFTRDQLTVFLNDHLLKQEIYLQAILPSNLHLLIRDGV